MEFKEIATGLKFPEGPVAMDDGSVIIVEIPIGRITRVTMDGKLHTVATPGGGPNGLAVGPDGHLYCCNNGGNFEMNEVNGLQIPGHTPPSHKGGRIERINISTGKVEVLYSECDGQKLLAPNDIVFDKTGGFWFTDHASNNSERRLHGRRLHTREFRRRLSGPGLFRFARRASGRRGVRRHDPRRRHLHLLAGNDEV
jgi:gluconolactonase